MWARRTLDPDRRTELARLMAADGLDTGFGDVDEGPWTAFATKIAMETGLGAGDSVFEVGCGAGAFLYVLRSLGIQVAGLDLSPALVGMARDAMPECHFSVAGADDVSVIAEADVVLSCGVFLYFPDLDYAARVVAGMAARARRAVAILDVPDAAKESTALDHRIARAGGPQEYAARYTGLDHRYYRKDWLADVMRSSGLVDVSVTDQDVAGYENAAFRFNAIGRRG